MFKKKVLSALFMMVCILSFTLVGCGQKTSSSNEKIVHIQGLKIMEN